MLEDCCRRSRTNWSQSFSPSTSNCLDIEKKFIFEAVPYQVWCECLTIDPHRSVHWWFNHTKLSWSSTLQLQLKQIHTTNQQKTQYALKSFRKLKPDFSSNIVVGIWTNKIQVVEIFLTKKFSADNMPPHPNYKKNKIKGPSTSPNKNGSNELAKLSSAELCFIFF